MAHDRYRFLDVQRGPLMAVRWLSATPWDRKVAVSASEAARIVRRLAADAPGSLTGLAELATESGSSAMGSHAVHPSRVVDQVVASIQARGLLIVPGWHPGRDPREPTPIAATAPAETASPPPQIIKSARTTAHDLLFRYLSNTGQPIVDDEGFELVKPDGSVETGELSNGKLERQGVDPGTYELRVRAIRGARWSVPEAHPFEEVRLVVETKGFPDGTGVGITVRPALGAPDAEPLASLTAVVTAGEASASWRYEQAVGEPHDEQLAFEAAIGKKRAMSGILTIVAHDASTARGVQERLRALGYDPGPPADTANDATTGALMRFQEDHPPLEVSGELDEWTRAMLEEGVS